MPLVRTYFTVYMDDPEAPEGYVEHRVEVRGADQLVAEERGKRMGVNIKDAMHQTYLWSWAAMVREGLCNVSFEEFMKLAIKVEGEKNDDAEPVDPTQPAVTAG